jgi:hypothetical protein
MTLAPELIVDAHSHITTRVLYPNVGGFGSANFLKPKDDTLKPLCAREIERCVPPGAAGPA